ncbi:hypothetical protein QFC21_004722 [Naganishia friedmannii]|uniref:Uncharacterized protein n=1 Tax=Naganishia friedmannii TaxID=89922 RepID=A0ACC2VF00_9TREE|nr:hypothetical protein QFC21_004722 [Naganishia friedmannii]
MSHRAPYSNRSHAASPAPILLSGPQGASSGRASPYTNSGLRSTYNHAANDDNQLRHPKPVPSGSGYAGNTTGAVPRFTESPYQADPYSRTAQQLEGQNDTKLEGLMSKVRILKDVTIGIGDEVRQSNMELGNMNEAFSSTSTFLSGTFQRMNRMAKRQGGQWCYLMLFLLLVLWIFVILWIKRR